MTRAAITQTNFAMSGAGRRGSRRRVGGPCGLGRPPHGWRSLAAAVLLLCSASAAPADEKPLEIGVLALGPRNDPVWSCGPGERLEKDASRETMPFYVRGLLDELDKLNYIGERAETAGRAGRRFNLDMRMGTLPELRSAVHDFTRKPVDIIVAIATAAVRVAQEETRDHPIPILFPGISDPVADGFVASLARPGGWITGVSHQQVQASGKRVELFKEMLPGLQRLITIRRAGYGPAEKSMIEVRRTTDRLKVELLDWTPGNRDELKDMLAKLRPDTADGILILPDSFAISSLDIIVAASLTQHVPIFGLQDFMADWGALGAYGPSAYQAGGRVARYIDKIVKGAKPADLPVEPVDPILVINLKVANCLGISIPPEVLHQADRVIR
jgi:putative ABC transport system substrate-binding protein